MEEQSKSAVANRLRGEISNLSAVISGRYTKPETTYVNGGGRSLLATLQRLEKRVSGLENRVGELIEANNGLRAEANVRQDELIVHREELMVLRPLRHVAVAIRKRFFSNFRSDNEVGGIGLPADNHAGNRIAHRGDVITDVLLFKKGLIDDNDSFKPLYGMDWPAAEEFTGKRTDPPPFIVMLLLT